MTVLADEVGDSRQRSQIIESASRLMTEGNEEMDQDARDCARDAMSKIGAHEALCTERWTQQREALNTLSHSMQTMQKSLDRYIAPGPAAIIGVLMGLVGFLGRMAFPIH